jgi:hypothetical protein
MATKYKCIMTDVEQTSAYFWGHIFHIEHGSVFQIIPVVCTYAMVSKRRMQPAAQGAQALFQSLQMANIPTVVYASL